MQRNLINKDNSQTVVAVASAAFIFSFTTKENVNAKVNNYLLYFDKQKLYMLVFIFLTVVANMVPYPKNVLI